MAPQISQIILAIENLRLRWILLLGLCLRIAAFKLVGDQQFPDSLIYIQAGTELFSSGQMSNQVYMPLYPAITHLMGGRLGAAIFDIFVSTSLIFLVHHFSLALFENKLGARLTSLVTACYPYFIFYSFSVLTETIFITLLIASFLLFYKGHHGWGCLLWIVNLMVKPVGELLTIPLLIVFCFALGWSRRQFVKNVVLTFVFYLLLMTPWWIHNYSKYDQFVRLTLADGIVFYSGNNPMNQSGGGIFGVDVDLSSFDHIQNPVERNNAMKSAAMDYIQQNPLRFIEMMGIKFVRFWRLWPYAQEYGGVKYIIISLLSFGLLLVLAVWQLFLLSRKQIQRLAPIFVFVGFLTLVHMVTIGSIRYRLPVEVFVILIASERLRHLLARQ